MKLKFVLITILSCFQIIWLFGQSESIYTQFNANPFILNPGVAGSNDQIEFRLTYRQQWGNFPGSPRTFTGTLHGNIDDKNAAGIIFTSDQLGVSKRNDIQLSYAFHIPLNVDETQKLALGAGAKLLQFEIDPERLYLKDRTDPSFGEMANTLTGVDVVFGAYYYGENFFAGISTPNLVRSGFDEVVNEGFTESYRHVYIMGAYRIKRESVSYEPALLVKTAERVPAQIEGNVKAFFVEERIMVGLGVRSDWLLSLMVGLKTPNNIHFFYSADFPTAADDPNAIRTYGISNEIMVGIDLKNFGK